MRALVVGLALFFNVLVSVLANASVSPRIINGDAFNSSVASKAEFATNWSYVAGYGEYSVVNGVQRFFEQCGASYAGNGWFVTAAHCIDSSQAQWDAVVVGSPYAPERSLIAVQQAIVHPLYDYGSIAFDLALLKVNESELSDAIARNNMAAPITWVTLATPTSPLSSQFRLAGWGSTDKNVTRFSFPDWLHRAFVVKKQDADCSNLYGDLFDPELMICAFGNIKPFQDSCSGDSGSGLLRDHNEGGVLSNRLEGVVSYGAVCGEAPSVYARADDPWLNQIINENRALPENLGLAVSSYLPTVTSDNVASGTVTITNHNNNAVTLSVQGVTNAAGQFDVEANGCVGSLAAKQSCEVTVRNSVAQSTRGGMVITVGGQQAFYPLYQRVSQALVEDDNFFIYRQTNWQYQDSTLTAPADSGQVVFDVKAEAFDGNQRAFLQFDLLLNTLKNWDTLSIDANSLAGRLEFTGECSERLAFEVSPGDTITLFYSKGSSERGGSNNQVTLANLQVVDKSVSKLATRSNCLVNSNYAETNTGTSGSKSGSTQIHFLAGLLLLLVICRKKRLYP